MGNERIRLTILIVVFGLTVAGVHAATRHRMEQKNLPNWKAVPYELGSWSGQDAVFDPIYGTDPSDTNLLRLYRQGMNPPVIAYVGFYGDLATIMEVHTPELCYPAQGWTILSSGKSQAGSYRRTQIMEHEALVDKDGNRRLVVWWDNAGSRPFEDRIRYVYAMLALSTLTGRTDGSMVRLETPVEKNDEAGARRRIDEFQKSFLPVLDKALPL